MMSNTNIPYFRASDFLQDLDSQRQTNLGVTEMEWTQQMIDGA